jgi:phage recombination protein Bet
MTGQSLIARMASQRRLDAETFYQTVKNTVMPSNATKDQLAAFLMVADRYGLDPLLKEIHAFPNCKGDGITPVVSIDGWVNLVNSHPQTNGFQVTFVEGKEGKPFSATCTMWRKDRDQPTVITEYYNECYRNTDPWNQMPHRMLRHKAFKEAARLAFGFAGITDEDEARDMMEKTIATVRVSPDTKDALDYFAAANAPAIVVDDDGVIADEPNPVSEGSSEPILPPTPPDEPAAAALTRDEAIAAILQIATQSHLGADKRIDWLNEKTLAFVDQFPKPFVKDLLQIGIRVAKGELTVDRGKTFLEQLP